MMQRQLNKDSQTRRNISPQVTDRSKPTRRQLDSEMQHQHGTGRRQGTQTMHCQATEKLCYDAHVTVGCVRSKYSDIQRWHSVPWCRGEGAVRLVLFLGPGHHGGLATKSSQLSESKGRPNCSRAGFSLTCRVATFWTRRIGLLSPMPLLNCTRPRTTTSGSASVRFWPQQTLLVPYILQLPTPFSRTAQQAAERKERLGICHAAMCA